ncbi:MAG: hypothetical protein JST19_13580 [Bacteroidetes bacterium]|nr:hypothetical protein [Bacteroidota bacterium]
MPAKKISYPELKERRLERPDAAQLALLEKSIYHSFKMKFSKDPNSGICYDGEPVKLGGDLNDFFQLIVKTYANL